MKISRSFFCDRCIKHTWCCGAGKMRVPSCCNERVLSSLDSPSPDCSRLCCVRADALMSCWRWGDQRHAPAALSSEMTRYPLCRRLGGLPGPLCTVMINIALTGIRSPDRPTRIVSLLLLSYPGCFINPLNAELNPICHLLALLGAHHIFHVSGLRVNSVCCITRIILLSYYFNTRTAVTQWLRRCAPNQKVAGSIPAGVIGIFH